MSAVEVGNKLTHAGQSLHLTRSAASPTALSTQFNTDYILLFLLVFVIAFGIFGIIKKLIN